jgi:hypothetical protein
LFFHIGARSPLKRWGMPLKDKDARRAYHAAYTLRRYHNDPAFRRKHAARRTLNNAVARGAVEKRPCETCGSSEAQAHHHDYDRALDVQWLCRECHEREHGGSGCRQVEPVVVGSCACGCGEPVVAPALRFASPACSKRAFDRERRARNRAAGLPASARGRSVA